MDIIEGFLFIMENEIWKDVVGYEGKYQINNIGDVKSLHYGKVVLLKPSINRHGYYMIGLWLRGKRKLESIHQLMAINYLNHVPNGNNQVVDHIDGNKINNNINNIRIVSHRFNNSYANRKNSKCFSSKHVGVSFSKSAKKWRAQIRINGKPIYLGSFDSETDAANAYKAKLIEII